MPLSLSTGKFIPFSDIGFLALWNIVSIPRSCAMCLLKGPLFDERTLFAAEAADCVPGRAEAGNLPISGRWKFSFMT